jgi:hypothetical protein
MTLVGTTFSRMTLTIMTIITTFSMMTLSTMTLIPTFGIVAFSIAILSMMPLSICTLKVMRRFSIKTLSVISINYNPTQAHTDQNNNDNFRCKRTW